MIDVTDNLNFNKIVRSAASSVARPQNQRKTKRFLKYIGFEENVTIWSFEPQFPSGKQALGHILVLWGDSRQR